MAGGQTGSRSAALSLTTLPVALARRAATLGALTIPRPAFAYRTRAIPLYRSAALILPRAARMYYVPQRLVSATESLTYTREPAVVGFLRNSKSMVQNELVAVE